MIAQIKLQKYLQQKLVVSGSVSFSEFQSGALYHLFEL